MRRRIRYLGRVYMNRLVIAVALILTMTSAAVAGNVYGSITEGGKPIAQGVKIEVACGPNKYSAETDASGAYKLFVKDQGKCALHVAYQGQTPSFEINSFEGSVQY